MYSRDNFCMDSEGEMYILKYILPYINSSLMLLQPLIETDME